MLRYAFHFISSIEYFSSTSSLRHIFAMPLFHYFRVSILFFLSCRLIIERDAAIWHFRRHAAAAIFRHADAAAALLLSSPLWLILPLMLSLIAFAFHFIFTPPIRHCRHY
jgi:hypothetical protein